MQEMPFFFLGQCVLAQVEEHPAILTIVEHLAVVWSLEGGDKIVRDVSDIWELVD